MLHSDISYGGISEIETLREDNFKFKKKNVSKNNDLFKLLFKKDKINYKEDDAFFFVKEILSKLKSNKCFLFSDEAATGTLRSYPDVIVKASRIKKVFDKVKIIIIIREQEAILKSHYRMHPFDPRDSFDRDYVSFDKWIYLEKSKKYNSYLDVIDYKLLYENYINIFGQDNILLLPIEMLKIDNNTFSEKISSFCQIDFEETKKLLSENQTFNLGVSKNYNRLRKLHSQAPFLGKLIRHMIPDQFKQKLKKIIHKGDREKIIISEQNRKFLQLKYSKGNAYLSEKLKISLEKYGYNV